MRFPTRWPLLALVGLAACGDHTVYEPSFQVRGTVVLGPAARMVGSAQLHLGIPPAAQPVSSVACPPFGDVASQSVVSTATSTPFVLSWHPNLDYPVKVVAWVARSTSDSAVRFVGESAPIEDGRPSGCGHVCNPEPVVGVVIPLLERENLCPP